jgi:hypothetical protein
MTGRGARLPLRFLVRGGGEAASLLAHGNPHLMRFKRWRVTRAIDGRMSIS